MTIPAFLCSEQWYIDFITFPTVFGIYTFIVIFNIVVTIYVMEKYAKGFILRARKNYWAHGTTNMETLIALGSVSAFSLFLFFFVRFTFEFAAGNLLTQFDFAQAIMSIN